MARTEIITMSMREVDRLKTVQAVADDGLKPMVAATRMGLTTRQVQRLVNRYRAEGVTGLVSRKRGRAANNQLAPHLAQSAITIIRDRYADFGPTSACTNLRELHGISLSKETVRRLMTEAGLWTPRVRRAIQKNVLHSPRIQSVNIASDHEANGGCQKRTGIPLFRRHPVFNGDADAHAISRKCESAKIRNRSCDHGPPLIGERGKKTDTVAQSIAHLDSKALLGQGRAVAYQLLVQPCGADGAHLLIDGQMRSRLDHQSNILLRFGLF